MTTRNTATVDRWTDPGRGPAIPERLCWRLGVTAVVLGWTAWLLGGGLWFFAAGWVAYGLINTTRWEAPE